jgi:hypothetical protein
MLPMSVPKFLIAIWLLMAALTANAGAQQNALPRVLGQFTISTGIKFQGVELGGLSGIDYDPVTRQYIALSDDAAKRGPVRFFSLALQLDADGIASLEVLGMTGLTNTNGRPYAADAVDPEEIRVLSNGNLVWTDEGTTTGVGPALIEMTRGGRAVGRYALPSYYQPAAEGRIGVRANLGHEALAVRADGRRLVAILENALAQDQTIATPGSVSPARMLVLDTVTRQPLAEYVYGIEPVPEKSIGKSPQRKRGVTSAIYLRDGRLLVMERARNPDTGYTIQIFSIDFADATNVLGQETLAGLNDLKLVRKSLILTLESGRNGNYIDNLEGMAQGPEIIGLPTLILVSDNNFRRHQVNQFLVVVVGANDPAPAKIR